MASVNPWQVFRGRAGQRDYPEKISFLKGYFWIETKQQCFIDAKWFAFFWIASGSPSRDINIWKCEESEHLPPGGKHLRNFPRGRIATLDQIFERWRNDIGDTVPQSHFIAWLRFPKTPCPTPGCPFYSAVFNTGIAAQKRHAIEGLLLGLWCRNCVLQPLIEHLFGVEQVCKPLIFPWCARGLPYSLLVKSNLTAALVHTSLIVHRPFVTHTRAGSCASTSPMQI